MNKTTSTFFAILLLLPALHSCKDNTLEPEGKVIDYDFTIMGTKSGSPSATTYRVMLLSSNGNIGEYPYLSSITVPSGTYRGPNTDERAWLTACEVDPATGTWISDTHQYGLRYQNGKYYISFVSPAVAPQQYKWNATTSKYEEWGFLHHRQPQPGEPELFISKPKLINSLAGNHLENQYVYDVPDDVVLKERRSKVTLKFLCGDELMSATVRKVGWTHLYESAYYNLRLDTLDTFTLSAPTDTVFVRETPFTVTNGGAAVEIDSTIFLFPLAYSAKDKHDEYVFERPEIDIYVAQGVGQIKMGYNLLAQYDYTYTITINSAYVSVSVTAAPWDTPDGPDSERNASIDETFPDYTFTITPATWNVIPIQKDTIQ